VRVVKRPAFPEETAKKRPVSEIDAFVEIENRVYWRVSSEKQLFR
jgi:hypothetical protein